MNDFKVMKISVIIPTYKPGTYIWNCLDSLEVQTFSKGDFEVILVLNGCKEPYYSQLKEYIAKSKVQYNFIQTDEGGVSNARNIALDKAKGEYITFIDDDDFVSPSYLEELYAKSSPDTIALCYPYAFKNDDRERTQLPYRITRAYDKLVSGESKLHYPRTRKFFSGPCMKLIPMSFIHGRRFDRRFKNGEDCLFMFLISNEFKWVNFTSKNAIYYRRVRENSANFGKRSSMAKVKNSLALIKEYSRIYFGNPSKYNFAFYATRILGAIKSVLA